MRNYAFKKYNCINLTSEYTRENTVTAKKTKYPPLPKVLIYIFGICISFLSSHLQFNTDLLFLFDDINSIVVFSDLASEASCVV